jgi:PHD/YefM family antitoxin component YafN of YafNO toxin-antitoxin module
VRILLHPGFHKTGTSSLQRGAQAYVTQLAPHLRLMLTPDVIEAARLARKFSAQPDIDLLRLFAEHFAEAIDRLDPNDPRAVLISAEDLSGYIPGHHDVAGYDAAPPLMNVATAVLRSHFGDEAEIHIWYTTRTARDWQRSVYWQNLRALRLTEEFETYRLRLHHAARLPEVVQRVAERLGRRAKVSASPIE